MGEGEDYIEFHRVPLAPVSGVEARERKEATERKRLSGSFERPTPVWDYMGLYMQGFC